MSGGGEEMIVIVDPRRPMGVGESLSGARAFYISVTRHDDWPEVETHPEYRRLHSADQAVVREKFTVSLERYLFLFELK